MAWSALFWRSTMRDRPPAEVAAFDELRAAMDAGDVRGEERAWHRLIVASGRKPQRFRIVVSGLNGRAPFGLDEDEA